MMVYAQECDGEMSAIISNAYVFDAIEVKPGEPIKNRYFTQNAAWDTGAEVSMISPRVVEKMGIKPFAHTSIMGIGGHEP